MRRMKRHNPKRKNAAKKRAKPASPPRRRRRRNDETAAPKARKKPVRRSPAEILREARERVARLEAGPKPKQARAKKTGGRVHRPVSEKGMAKARQRVIRAVAKDPSLFQFLSPEERLDVASVISTRKKATAERKAGISAAAKKRRSTKRLATNKALTKRARAARIILRKGSKQSKGSLAVARAWRSAMTAQRSAQSPAERKLLSAMGIAGVPNPSMGGMFKDIGTLLPQMGVSAVSLAIAAVAGQMIASKIIPAEKQTVGLYKFAPSGISLGVGFAAYMVLRKSKSISISKLAPWALAGGVAAAAVHAIARITVKKDGADVSLGKALGLPIGEYASMAGYGEYASMAGHRGMGEYASMAGGTSYSGSRGVFAGLDDTDPVLSGTDDEDEVDMLETDADEGVNSDEGSLNGSIFD